MEKETGRLQEEEKAEGASEYLPKFLFSLIKLFITVKPVIIRLRRMQ